MGKPSTSILGSDKEQRLGNSLLKRFSCTSPLSAQTCLHFGERLFNGREIRRISRQEQETAPSGFNGLSHTRSLMNAEAYPGS